MAERVRSKIVTLVEERTTDTPGIKTGVETPDPSSLLLTEWIMEVAGKLLNEFKSDFVQSEGEDDLSTRLCVEIICIASELIWLQHPCWDPNGVVSPEDVVRELEADGTVPKGILEHYPERRRRRRRRRAAT